MTGLTTTISPKTHTVREIAVMMDRDLAKYGATVAKFATVQNQGN